MPEGGLHTGKEDFIVPVTQVYWLKFWYVQVVFCMLGDDVVRIYLYYLLLLSVLVIFC